MTAREILNLIDWLRAQGFDNDKIIECIEVTEEKKVNIIDITRTEAEEHDS